MVERCRSLNCPPLAGYVPEGRVADRQVVLGDELVVDFDVMVENVSLWV